MRDVRGKVAVVTGGASGLGYAMCERFAAEGMSLVMADLAGPGLEEAAERLRATGTKVMAVPTDVSSWEQMQALAARTKQEFGGAHVVCNNAGIRTMASIWETSIEDWRWVVGVDLWGVIHGVKAFVPDMIARGEPGHIVNTSSLAGLITGKQNAPYAVSKFGVVALTEVLHGELKQVGAPIGASVLCPGLVRTKLRENSNKFGPIGAPVALLPEGPLPDELTPEEVAEQVFDAIRNDRLWIITHASSLQLVRRRHKGIVETGEVVLLN